MPHPSGSDTIQSKRIEATSACQRASLLLQQAPEINTLEQIAAALNQAQSAIAVMAHSLRQSDTKPPLYPPHEAAAPIPSEPLALDGPIADEEQDSPFTEGSASEFNEPLASVPEFQLDSQDNPSAGTSLAQRLSESRLDSIQKALSINDRVRFAAELAHGNMEHFQTLCQTIDSAENQGGAILSVQSTCDHVTDWEDEEGAPFQFLQLVRRVFA